jgi:hypothetical protein
MYDKELLATVYIGIKREIKYHIGRYREGGCCMIKKRWGEVK